MIGFWLGAYYGFWVGFIGATCWRHWVSLYEPKEPEAGRVYIATNVRLEDNGTRTQPYGWRRELGS